MRAALCILLCAFLSLSLGTVPASARSKKKIRVREVTFQGNNVFSDKRLKGLILTRPSVFLSPSYYYPEILSDDLDNIIIFYQQNGFLEAKIIDHEVTVDSSEMKVDLRISMEEGELTRVEGISVFGNTVFTDSTLLRLVKLRKGDAFKRSQIQGGMLSILSLYADSGYLDATVKPEVKLNAEAHLAMVDFVVSERNQCTVSEIRIDGQRKTRRKIITRELLCPPGQIIRYSKLLESQRRLYLTGLFESVFIRPESAASGDSMQKDILVELKENLSSEFNVSVGYGSIEKLHGRIELLSRNLAGMAWQAGVSVGASFIRRGIEGSFTEPWTLGTRWRTDVNLLFELLEEPGYDLSRFGARLTVGRAFRQHSNAALTLRYEDARLRHIEVSRVPEDIDPKVRSLILSIAHDTRDNMFNPGRGVFVEWSNEAAGAFLKSTNSFMRSVFIVKWFYPWTRETILGSAFEIGWMDYLGASDEIPLNERFYAGGPNSIRGFGYQSVGPMDRDDVPLGGRFKIVWNVGEIRRTIFKMIGGVVFLDLGGVWSRPNDFSIDGLRAAVGAGLRANTPIGILRFDYGVNLDRRDDEKRSIPFFSMGHAF
jgi:outer membrane protein insertion porin family